MDMNKSIEQNNEEFLNQVPEADLSGVSGGAVSPEGFPRHYRLVWEFDYKLPNGLTSFITTSFTSKEETTAYAEKLCKENGWTLKSVYQRKA